MEWNNSAVSVIKCIFRSHYTECNVILIEYVNLMCNLLYNILIVNEMARYFVNKRCRSALEILTRLWYNKQVSF